MFLNLLLQFTAIPQVTSLYNCKTYIRSVYAVAVQLISFLQGIFCACVLRSLLIWTAFWICPLPSKSFSTSWCIIDLWVFYLLYCSCSVSQAPFWCVVGTFELLPLDACLWAGPGEASWAPSLGRQDFPAHPQQLEDSQSPWHTPECPFWIVCPPGQSEGICLSWPHSSKSHLCISL